MVDKAVSLEGMVSEKSAPFRKAFGAAVRQFRERCGLSQEKFAFESGLDRTYISGVECGVRNPTIEVVQRLAQALGTTPSKLMAAAEKLDGKK